MYPSHTKKTRERQENVVKKNDLIFLIYFPYCFLTDQQNETEEGKC